MSTAKTIVWTYRIQPVSQTLKEIDLYAQKLGLQGKAKPKEVTQSFDELLQAATAKQERGVNR